MPIDACGYVNVPKCVTLRSDNTKKTAEIAATMRLGRAVFKQRFADPDAQFAADEQFEIVCDKTDRYAWVLCPLAGVRKRSSGSLRRAAAREATTRTRCFSYSCDGHLWPPLRRHTGANLART